VLPAFAKRRKPGYALALGSAIVMGMLAPFRRASAPVVDPADSA